MKKTIPTSNLMLISGEDLRRISKDFALYDILQIEKNDDSTYLVEVLVKYGPNNMEDTK